MIEKNLKSEAPESAVKPSVISSDKGTMGENTLRPKSLEDYIGQDEVKAHLHVFMEAAKKRKEPLEHLLLHGAPGLGKTTLAFILAKEMDAPLRITSGPALERPGDLAALLTNLKPNEVLFIDEVHRLKPTIEEILYSAMEDYVLDIVLLNGSKSEAGISFP